MWSHFHLDMRAKLPWSLHPANLFNFSTLKHCFLCVWFIAAVTFPDVTAEHSGWIESGSLFLAVCAPAAVGVLTVFLPAVPFITFFLSESVSLSHRVWPYCIFLLSVLESLCTRADKQTLLSFIKYYNYLDTLLIHVIILIPSAYLVYCLFSI